MNLEIYKNLESLEDFVKIEHWNSKIEHTTAMELIRLISDIKEKLLTP